MKKKRRDKKKYAPSSLTLCTVCNNEPPTGHCIICNLRRNPNEYQSKWRSRYEFLKQTWDDLKKHNMKTTGNAALDEEIKAKLGHWIPQDFREILKRLERHFE